jgi:hypothetical protein
VQPFAVFSVGRLLIEQNQRLQNCIAAGLLAVFEKARLATL